MNDIERVVAAAPAAQGYLRTETHAYALGPSTQLDGEAPMLDWRTSPLAEVFFRYRPGESYELELADERAVAGTVRERWLIAGRGRVDALIGEDRIVEHGVERPLAIPAPREVPPTDRSSLPVLDRVQQAAVELSAETSLVLDGEAGVGKTLVALFRVAALARRARDKSRRFRALVLVPTEGLRRLVRLLAERLGIERLEIGIVDDWLIERARAAFKGLPARTSSGAHAQVIGLKRHPAVRVALADFIGWKPERGVDDDKVSKARTRLLHLFGDRDRLQRILDASGEQLPARAIALVMQHTRVQFETTSERAHRHVDANRLVALDGRTLDAGTPTENARTFDVEDAPVLFELARRGALAAGRLADYDHIVVDEAQLRSPLELAAIGDALAPHGTTTLAGDHRQATDESAWFTGWPAAKAELRRARWADVTLDVTYRSVPAISDFARGIVERRAGIPDEPPVDPAVWATASPHALAQAARLCWHLTALTARDPWRQICVIARTPEHARRLHAELSRGLDPVLVLDGDFRFEPGVIVTPAAAISGLEFDAVVIPDLDPEHYPATPELARTLYVAATRARDWLWVLTAGPWSPLVCR